MDTVADPLGLWATAVPNLRNAPPPSGKSNWAIVAILLIAVGFVAWDRYVPDGSQEKRNDHNQGEIATSSVRAIVIIEETGDRVRFPHVASVLNDTTFWDALDAKNIPMRPYEVESADADKYRDAAKAVGLPAVLLIGDSNKVLVARPLPPTTTGLSELLESVQ